MPVAGKGAPAARGSRRMSRGCAVAIGAVVVFVAAAVATLWFIESRYEAVFRSPRVSHEIYAKGSTALRVVLRPPMAQRRLVSLALPDRDVPDWILGAVVPEETALFFSADLDDRVTEVTAFVNYPRFGPVLRDAINTPGVLGPVSGVTWAPTAALLDRRGVLILQGTLPISPQLASAVSATWDASTQFTARSLDGGHAIEALLENRNGLGFAILWSLFEANAVESEEFSMLQTIDRFRNIATIRAFADFQDPDSLAIEVLAESVPGASTADMNGIKVGLDLVYIQLRTVLRDQYDIALIGNSEIKGEIVHGQYTLSEAGRFLGILFGTQAPPP